MRGIHTCDLRDKIAKAIVSVDEQKGGLCWDKLMENKDTKASVFDRADSVIALLETLCDNFDERLN